MRDGRESEGTDFGVEFGVESTVTLRGALFVTLELLGAESDGAELDGAELRGAELRGAELDGAELLGAELDGAELLGTESLGTLFETLELLGAELDGAELLGTELLDELESSEPRPCLAEAGLISNAVVAASPTATMAAVLNIRRVLFAVLAVVVALVLMLGSLVWGERFCSRRLP